MQPTTPDYDDLRRREAALRATGATPRMRDAADALGAPEAALVEARRESGEAIRLRSPAGAEGVAALLDGLGAIGEAMALTRNAHCVIERHGRYAAPTIEGDTARLDGDIALSAVCSRWAFAYALTERTHKTPLRSLQIFDRAGTAIHKAYPTPESDMAAFDALIAAMADPDAPPAAFETAGETETPPAEIGRPVAEAAARALLDGAAQSGAALRISVGNAGCEQSFAGRVETIKPTGPWINVLDPRFNLHLRWDRIAAAIVTQAPADCALALSDGDGARICRMAAGDEAAEALIAALV